MKMAEGILNAMHHYSKRPKGGLKHAVCQFIASGSAIHLISTTHLARLRIQ